ncbi:MAG: hypothetical protein AMK69_24685 [Nitrospira bacterium SG8_3]|nr:MAG: hypothetical protein AMK69_24685 [Nitrospira bacterium SG8_3]
MKGEHERTAPLKPYRGKGVSHGRPYSTGLCWPIGGESRLSLLTGLLVFAESFPDSNTSMPKGICDQANSSAWK